MTETSQSQDLFQVSTFEYYKRLVLATEGLGSCSCLDYFGLKPKTYFHNLLLVAK